MSGPASAVFYLRDAKNTVVHEGVSVRECDEVAESMWDRFRYRTDALNNRRLPRVLVEVDTNGNEHVVHIYPKEK